MGIVILIIEKKIGVPIISKWYMKGKLDKHNDIAMMMIELVDLSALSCSNKFCACLSMGNVESLLNLGLVNDDLLQLK